MEEQEQKTNKWRKANSVTLTVTRCTYEGGDHYSLELLTVANEYRSPQAAYTFQHEHKLMFVQFHFHEETNASSWRGA